MVMLSACVYNPYNISKTGSDKSIMWSFAIRKKKKDDLKRR